jgi:BTB/POZ domain
MIPKKRKRVKVGHGAPRRGCGNTTHELEQVATTQSEVHWFDDGNIILQAESKLFKVHRGVLAKHSNVFQDMFSLPQPPNQPTAEHEGCPSVMLADSELDVHHFLNAIYSP